jgi:hypothetical protein
MRVGKKKLVSAMILLGCVAVLGIARCLQPDARGYGTHQQLHLPPCAFQALTGLPCMTCGMTTAFALGARGEFGRAFVTQPCGLVLFLGVIALAVDSIVALGTDRTLRQARLPWKRIWLTVAAICALAWGYKLWIVIAGR